MMIPYESLFLHNLGLYTTRNNKQEQTIKYWSVCINQHNYKLTNKHTFILKNKLSFTLSAYRYPSSVPSRVNIINISFSIADLEPAVKRYRIYRPRTDTTRIKCLPVIIIRYSFQTLNNYLLT